MKKLIIYGASWCPSCVKAKGLVEERGIEFIYFDIDEQPEVRNHLRGKGFKTIPQIFEMAEDGETVSRHIGGYDDLVVALNNDE